MSAMSDILQLKITEHMTMLLKLMLELICNVVLLIFWFLFPSEGKLVVKLTSVILLFLPDVNKKGMDIKCFH